MPGRNLPNIRWTKRDAARISQLVRRFNAKLTRTIKKKGESYASVLPPRLNSSQLQEELKKGSRADFNRQIAQYERFLRPGMEEMVETKGAPTTKWQKKEAQYLQRRILNQKKREIEHLKPSPLYGNERKVSDLLLDRPEPDINTMSAKGIEDYFVRLNRILSANYSSEKQRRYIDNYLKAIQENLGSTGEIESIISRLVEMDPALVVDALSQAGESDPRLDFYFYLDPLTAQQKLSRATEAWRQYERETTTDPKDCRVWAFGVVEVGNTQNFYWGKTLDEFMERFLTKDCHTCYFHNLKFDGEFILHWLLTNGYTWVKEKKEAQDKTFTTLISDMGQFYTIDIYKKWDKTNRNQIALHLIDSLKILPLSVKEIAGAFKMSIQKTEIDYDKIRPVGYEMDETEREYLYNDCAIIAKALENQFQQGLKKLTQASNAFHDYKERVGKKQYAAWFPAAEV